MISPTALSTPIETIIPDIYFVRDSEAERRRVTAPRPGRADQPERAIGRMHLPHFEQITDLASGFAPRRRRGNDGGREHLGRSAAISWRKSKAELRLNRRAGTGLG